MPSPEHTAYSATVSGLRDLGDALLAVAEVQWAASPHPMVSGDPDPVTTTVVIANPTLDAVLDPRRLAIRAAVHDATMSLQITAAGLAGHAAALRQALAAWEGY